MFPIDRPPGATLDRIDDILDVMEDACVALDSEWRIVYANAAAARLTGEPVNALLGLICWDKWPQIRGTRIETECRRIVQSGIPARFEYQFTSVSSSSPSWLEIQGCRSSLGGVNVFFRDITERKRAEAEAAHNLQRELLVRKISEAALRATEAGSVLEVAVAGLAEALDLDRCYYAVHDAVHHIGTIICEWRRPGLGQIAGEYRFSEYTPNASEFYKLGRLQIIDDTNAPQLSDEMPLPAPLIRQLGLTAMVRAPLTAGSTVNALVAAMATGPRAWTEAETALVQAIADKTTEMVQSLQIQERHRRVATVLQDALQPRIPDDIPGLEIAAYLKPAIQEANVGGDFYDVFQIDRTRYALIIGDVSGKGVEAAAQVSMLRNMVRGFLYQEVSPRKAALDLNSVVVDHDLLAGFATLFIGIYDSSDRSLRYASCGHELPILLSAGAMSTLKTCGPPIGAGQGVDYEEDRLELRMGDLLVMYTDGLSEAGPDRRNLLGTEGIVDILQRHARENAVSAIAGNVVADVLAFANGQLRDDACLIVVRLIEDASAKQQPGREDVRMNDSAGLAAHNWAPVSAGGGRPTLHGHVMPQPIDEQFRLLVESVAEYAIFLLDTKGRIMTWNKGAERVKGYSASEIVGKHFSIFYTQEDIQRGHPLDELAIAATEGRYEEEGWRLRKDGSRFWANVVITALYDPHGNLCGFGKVTRDFTDRRRAEQELRRSEERFRHLVQGVRDYAIFMLDMNGHVISWNEGAQRIKGYYTSEILGEHFSRFYTPEDIAAGKPERELVIATAEGRYEDEGWRVRKDGTRFWANVVITSLRDEAGNLYGFAKVTRDFTERKAAEEANLQTMRDEVSRSFLRDVLFSVTEGRLRFCDSDTQLPEPLPCWMEATVFDRNGLADIRNGLREAASSIGFPEQRLEDLITATSEAAMNAVVHAKGAEYTLCGTPTTMQVWIRDRGRGIELANLHRATLERGFTTEDSLGHGFWLMLRTSDRLWLYSTSSGTTIVLEQDAVAAEPAWLTRRRDLADYIPPPDHAD